MNSAYFLGIDQGTTGSTALIVEVLDGGKENVLSSSTVEFSQHYPKSSYVEHDLDEIWGSVSKACIQALEAAELNSKFSRKELTAIGISNQRETVCFYEPHSSQPLRRAIVWQCRRSSTICSRLRQQGLEAEITDKTGLCLDPYFSGTKISWVLEHEPHLAQLIREKKLWIGTIDSYLLSRLSGGRVHATEPSNASRTLMYNLDTGSWDPQLLEMLGLEDASCLAQIQDSASLFAYSQGVDFLPDGIPISGVLGDQQAALAGQACFRRGEVKCTYGTGAFVLSNTGSNRQKSQHRLLSTVAWQLDGKRSYALEGSCFVAGAAIQFLRDNLGLLESAEASEELAQAATAAPDLYFVPALTGLGAPWWNPNATGAFLGLTRATGKGQLVRAALEGIALLVNDLLACMRADMGSGLDTLRVDGGASRNNLLMQVQADLSGIEVQRPKGVELTALGAARFAGLGCGFYQDLTAIAKMTPACAVFSPQQGKTASTAAILSGWGRAIAAVERYTCER